MLYLQAQTQKQATFRKKIFILLNLQFLTGNYRNWQGVVQHSLVCLVLTAELPGPPLIPEPKLGASGWCEHCCWHSTHDGLFWVWMSLTSHLPAEGYQVSTHLGWGPTKGEPSTPKGPQPLGRDGTEHTKQGWGPGKAGTWLTWSLPQRDINLEISEALCGL